MPEAERLTRRRSVGEAKHKRRRSRIGSTTSDCADRIRRRLRANAHSTLAQQTNRYEAVTAHSSYREVEINNTAQQPAATPAASLAPIDESKGSENQDPKPWETLVVGANLGENLSRVEYKDREILQQKYIVNWYEEHQPSVAPHQSAVLAQLVKERAKMKNTHENITPIEELRHERAITDRLDILRKTLETSRCNDEAVNIRAAITGYESGQITCSDQFTLIYAGRIVHTCPSYNSFSIDRDERLDGYAQQYGPGWLWHEPPLAGNGSSAGAEVHAKKGFCLEQSWHKFDDFGLWPISMRFVTHEDKVRRKSARTEKSITQGRKRKRSSGNTQEEENFTSVKSCTFKMMLDTGATFPVLRARDLVRLGIDTTTYAAQSVLPVHTVSGQESMRYYELYVGMGSALKSGPEPGPESSKKETGWPLEKGVMGGLCPVFVNGLAEEDDEDSDEDSDEEFPDRLWTERLSGIMPFKACYVSSVPTAGRIWMGEDRRDVLGSQRMPPYRRFSTHHVVDPGDPSDMQDVQNALGTPDEVTFYHRLTGGQEKEGGFIDRDSMAHDSQTDLTIWSEVRGGQVLHRNRFGPKQAKKIPKLNGLSWRRTREV